MFGALEAGGTKFVCGTGTGPDDLTLASFPTSTPEATMAPVIQFFHQQGSMEAVGIGSFGPVDRDPASSGFGRITSTPKSAWRDFDIAGVIRAGLRVPVGFDTDVNAAALAEARWGAGRGLTDFLYLTVGTGIGGAAVASDKLVHGLVHPEMGHLRIPHDWKRDPYPGCCPYHGDCLEGLASGPALQARWGAPAESLPANHEGWILEARYLALGLASLALAFSPQRILLGGGVMRQATLFERIRAELAVLLNGYVRAGEIVPPQLGSRAGVLGALVLAEQAYHALSTPGSNA